KRSPPREKRALNPSPRGRRTSAGRASQRGGAPSSGRRPLRGLRSAIALRTLSCRRPAATVRAPAWDHGGVSIVDDKAPPPCDRRASCQNRAVAEAQRKDMSAVFMAFLIVILLIVHLSGDNRTDVARRVGFASPASR